MKVTVETDPDAVAERASATIARWLLEAADSREGRVTLGLAGGGTPRPTYLRLREETAPWDRVDAWMTDERWVAPDDPESNGRMARESLTDHVDAELHEPPWSAGDPRLAAAAYEETLRTLLAGPVEPRPPDVVLLGIGDDGHTASLFPGTTALAEEDRLYVANRVEAKDSWRLTATIPLLCSAQRVAFLVTGASKAPVVAAIIDEGADLPAGRVATGAADVTWFLDRAAAAELPH